MNGVGLVMRYAVRESLRRRVFVVVLVLTVLFLMLYAYGTSLAFDSIGGLGDAGETLEEEVLAGSTIFGLAMFSILFLGAVLAVFLTHSAVRGDAERGLLQPLVVRPLGRTQLLVGRFAAAGAVCAGYVLAVYFCAMLITGAVGGWWPDRILGPGLALAAGVCVIAALTLLGSVYMTATANGIAVFMVFGAGLAAGLLGQIGEGLNSDSLEQIGEVASWLLPFEALYQSGLHGLTADAGGFTDIAVQLGPFGGAQGASAWLWPWALAYVALVGLVARWGFLRRDV